MHNANKYRLRDDSCTDVSVFCEYLCVALHNRIIIVQNAYIMDAYVVHTFRARRSIYKETARIGCWMLVVLLLLLLLLPVNGSTPSSSASLFVRQRAPARMLLCVRYILDTYTRIRGYIFEAIQLNVDGLLANPPTKTYNVDLCMYVLCRLVFYMESLVQHASCNTMNNSIDRTPTHRTHC